MRWGRGIGLVVGVGYAAAVAATTPFTTTANLLVAIPLAVLAVAVIICWPAKTGPRDIARTDGHPFRPWVLLVIVGSIWELWNYVAPGSRSEHPTFSSMVDATDRYRILKTLVVLAWLAIGWMIVTRGRKAETLGKGEP